MDWNESRTKIVLESDDDASLAFHVLNACLAHDRGERQPWHQKPAFESLPHTLSPHTTRFVMECFERVAADARDLIGVGHARRHEAYTALVGLNNALGAQKDTGLESRIKAALETPTPD